MHLTAIGINHNTASVELREKLAIPERDLPAMLERLMGRPVVQEAVILSTCNRTELYCAVESETETQAEEELTSFLAGVREIGRGIENHLYSFADGAAVAHLMDVSAGLDSMILGEYQILGQVKAAYSAAQAARTTGPLLNHLFQSALAAGKRVRTDTEIGRGVFSVGSAAVELATQIFGESLAGRAVLVLGAGKMSDLTVRHLQASGATSIVVANRTHERAVQLARELGNGACARRYEDLPACLASSDIVICSTSAPHAVVTRPLIETAMRERRNRALFIIDIAVPRDVEASVGDVDEVYLFNIDDLKQVVAEAKGQRLKLVKDAQAIVESAVNDYLVWWRSLDVAPLISAVRRRLETMAADEIARIRLRSPGISDKEARAMESAVRATVAKLAHTATEAIKQSAQAGGDMSAERLDAIRSAFGLEPEYVEEIIES